MNRPGFWKRWECLPPLWVILGKPPELKPAIDYGHWAWCEYDPDKIKEINMAKSKPLQIDSTELSGAAGKILTAINEEIKNVKTTPGNYANPEKYLNDLETVHGNLRSASIVVNDFLARYPDAAAKPAEAATK